MDKIGGYGGELSAMAPPSLPRRDGVSLIQRNVTPI